MHRLTSLVVLFAVAACTGVSPTQAPSAPPSASPGVTTAPTAAPTPRVTPTPVPEPTTTPTACPSGEPTFLEFVDTEAACFADRPVTLTGWFDAPTAMGWEGPVINPAWLAYPDDGPFMAFWNRVPVDRGDGDIGCPEGVACTFIFPHVDPGTNVTLPHARGWYRLTGHYFDAAAETCHYVPIEGDTEPMPADADAISQCRAQWVVSKIEAMEAPA